MEFGNNGQVKLTQSTWTAPILLSLCFPGDVREDCAVFIAFLMIPTFASFAFCVTAQMIFIYFLQQQESLSSHDDDAEAQNCHGGDYILRGLCLLVFVAYTLETEILVAWETYRWLNLFPKWDEVSHSKVIAESAKRSGDRTSFVVYKITTADGSSGHVPAVGISTQFYITAVICCVIGRVVTVGFIMVYGSSIILFSETNLDLILNSVAVGFIVDIDDYLYAYFTSSSAKTRMEAMPPLALLDHNFSWGDMANEALGFYVRVGLLFGLSAAIFQAFCLKETLAAWLGLGIPLLCLSSTCIYCIRRSSMNDDGFNPADMPVDGSSLESSAATRNPIQTETQGL